LTIRVKELWIYPLKGAQGVRVNELKFSQHGLIGDRRFVVVNEAGMFVAQRGERGRGIAIPEMALVRVTLTRDHYVFDAPGMSSLRIPVLGFGGAETTVQIWDEHVPAMDLGIAANAWFTRYLDQFKPGNYRLVRMPEASRTTPAGENWSGFADSYPVLGISQESLDYLNSLLAAKWVEPLDWPQFRPNVVWAWEPDTADKPLPFWEDDVEFVVTPGQTLHAKTRCARCIVTTINQQTLERGREPLLTLREFRQDPEGNKVYFGRNLHNLGSGSIRVGDPVYLHHVPLTRSRVWLIAAADHLSDNQRARLAKVTVYRRGRLFTFRYPGLGKLVLESGLVHSPVAGDVNERWFSNLLAPGQTQGYRLVRRPN
jgi:uncharacterized protein YcbX